MTEKRAAKRKVFHASVALHLDGAPPSRVQTIDITDIGMGLASETPVPVGRNAKVAVSLFFGGKNHQIEVSGRTIYCLYCSQYGFKIGLQFGELPGDVRQVVTKYLDY